MLTDQQHPITPPPELVERWIKEPGGLNAVHVATQAARWGFKQCIKVDAASLEDKLQKARDQELEACCSWADATGWYGAGDMLRAARRPKPPSLAEQALTVLEQTMVLLMPVTGPEKIKQFEAIRAALERLQELEEGNE